MNTDPSSIFKYGENYSHHKSSFGFDANIVAAVAYFVPAIIAILIPRLSSFSALILILIGMYEKESLLVKFHCYQWAFFSVACSLFLTALSLLTKVLFILAPITAVISAAIGILTLVCFIWSVICAFRWKTWKMPGLGDYIDRRFM